MVEKWIKNKISTIVYTTMSTSNKFCVRINLYDGYESKIKEFYSDRESYPKVFIGFHIGKSGENPHYHIVHTVDKSVTTSAMRKRFKTVFTLGKGNGHISLKEWDGKIDAIAYIYHEDMQLVPTLTHGFTDEEIVQAKAINSEHQATIKGGSPTKMLEQVYERIMSADGSKKQCNVVTGKYEFVKFSHSYLFGCILDWYKAKGDWMPNRFQLVRYIMKLQSMINCHEEDWERLKGEWYTEMFQERKF